MSATQQNAGGALRRTSGRDREEWFSALDEWGALGRPYDVIAAWLTGEGLSDWWAQKIIVEYEQERGVRQPGVRRDGTFSATASKTIAVPSERVFAAVSDPEERKHWLPNYPMVERTSRPFRSVRLEHGDGTRISFDIAAAGVSKTQVAVEHARLTNAGAVSDGKIFWRERLSALKALLEA